jgi:hypothetical protein
MEPRQPPARKCYHQPQNSAIADDVLVIVNCRHRHAIVHSTEWWCLPAPIQGLSVFPASDVVPTAKKFQRVSRSAIFTVLSAGTRTPLGGSLSMRTLSALMNPSPSFSQSQRPAPTETKNTPLAPTKYCSHERSGRNAATEAAWLHEDFAGFEGHSTEIQPESQCDGQG